MSPDDLQFVAELARRRLGLKLRADRAYVTEARLQPVARREGLADIQALVERVRAEPDGPLGAALLEALAAADSAFFRDRQVFERLQAEVLPALARRRPDGVVRLWSVGCGAGQEVYSVAIGAAESAEPGLDLKIFASDVSERALQKARSGAYTHFEVQRGLPVKLLLRWFEKQEEVWRVAAKLRQQVRWAKVNLIDDLSRLGPFDVILCRNVLSAFHPDAAEAAVGQLAQVLAPDGTLVLGSGESLAPEGFVGSGGVLTRTGEADQRAA